MNGVPTSGKLAWLTLMAACLESESDEGVKLVLTDLSSERDQIPVWRLGGIDFTPVELLALGAHRHQIELVAAAEALRSTVEELQDAIPQGRISFLQ